MNTIILNNVFANENLCIDLLSDIKGFSKKIEFRSHCSLKSKSLKNTMKTAFILISFLLTVHSQRIHVITKLVQDLIKNEKVPTVLSIIACWTQSDNLYIAKSSGIPIQISSKWRIINRIIDDSTNKLMYFIDMRCNGSYKFLGNLDKLYFSHPYRWIMFEPIEDRLANSTFLTDSNIIYVNFNQDSDQYNLKQGNLM